MVKKKVIALDIGGTNTRAAIVDENFQIEKEYITPTIKGDVDKFIDNVFKTIDALKPNLDEIVSIGVGVPGVVNKDNGYIYALPNVLIKEFPLGQELNKRYNRPVFIRNDAELAALAEAKIGKGKDYDRVFFITISTGLGGALIVNKENQDYITEIGHTALMYNGELSEYELLASGPGIVKLASIHGLKIKDSKEFFASIGKSELHKKVFNEWVDLINSFIKLIKDSYEPEIIVFTGGVMKSKEHFFDLLIKANEDVIIEECGLKESAGLYGAAIYAFDKVVK